jgi:hypothetical protein
MVYTLYKLLPQKEKNQLKLIYNTNLSLLKPPCYVKKSIPAF